MWVTTFETVGEKLSPFIPRGGVVVLLAVVVVVMVVCICCCFLVVALPMSDNASAMSAGDGLRLIHPEDLENHNKDGGAWVVQQGRVYNIDEFQQEVCVCVSLDHNQCMYRLPSEEKTGQLPLYV